ncbi:MAG: hypothetical protein K9K38_10965 [Rhodoferax sp.]|nr:hypothetical protein [Rhodoferax sp.]
MSSPGVKLHGAGFIVSPEEARALGQGSLPGLERVIREYRNGRDLTDATRGVKVIDAFGMCADQLRSQYPAVYQWLMERVKPERDQNNRATYRDNWWIFGEPRKDLRPALHGLPRYIATVETAKHRTFQFLDASILPDNKLIAIALADAFHLGVLSSRAHGSYALAAGSWLGVGNDPVYVKSRCFETFPFPDQDTGLTPELRARIANLAEQIDAHRKKVLAQSGAVGVKLTLTALYNVLEALKENRPLSAKEKLIHTHGLVGVLKELHDELDAAVLQAYGLTAHANTDDILSHLVALNQQRALEEAQGTVRWLRPEFQNPTQPTNESLSTARLYPQTPQPQQASLMLESTKFGSAPAPEGLTSATQFTEPPLASVVTWPATLPEQVRAVAQVLSGSTTALTLEQIEARFKGKGGWKKGLPTLLATLEALGRAQPTQVADTTVWRA